MTSVKVDMLFAPAAPRASIVCLPFLPDRRRRGMLPLQANVPFEAALVLHRTVLALLCFFSPLRYSTTIDVPGEKPEPRARTGTFRFPDDGVRARVGVEGAGVIGSEMGVTVNAATPDTSELGSVAVIVTAPVATPVARPWDPAVFEMVAVPAADDAHVTESVR